MDSFARCILANNISCQALLLNSPVCIRFPTSDGVFLYLARPYLSDSLSAESSILCRSSLNSAVNWRLFRVKRAISSQTLRPSFARLRFASQMRYTDLLKLIVFGNFIDNFSSRAALAKLDDSGFPAAGSDEIGPDYVFFVPVRTLY